MKPIIFYVSQTGFTKRYAQWLAQELGCEAVAAGPKDRPDLSEFDTVIFASWLHAGTIINLSWFKSLPLTGKRRYVLVTGAAPMDSDLNQITWDKSFEKDREDYEIFYVTGGLNYEKMCLKDRFMMSVFKKIMKAKKDKNEMETEMAKMLGQSFDASRREYLNPLIQSIRSAR